MSSQTHGIGVAAMLLTLSLSVGDASAQGQNIGQNVAPIRPELTRPGGMPGAPRAVLAEELYMRAVPVKPPATKKKRRKRRR